MSSKKQKNIRLPVHIKPERYKIILRPNFEDFTFFGEETIYLSLTKATKQIILHAHELTIDSVQVSQQGREFDGKINYQEEDETVTFIFPKLIKKGKAELKLKFRGTLNDKMRGFYKSKYSINGEEKYLATTQFESTDARRAFPCFDEPHQKAIFDVTLMIPSHMKAISNTIETNVWEHESGYQVVEFAPTPKMSTYLLAFIVGEFEYLEGKTKEGIVVRVFVTPGKKDQARFALDVAKKCLSFFNNFYGIDYPLPVLDLIAVPDFAAGAMENWGAITYRESALLIDEQLSAASNRQRVAIVIAHEIAHQWFGNLVTMEWWTHLWLNEGFASYMEYLAVDHIFPQWDIWTQFVYLDQGVALKLDSLKNTHPIEVEVHHPGEISEIFDKVSYSKGASIIRMLAEYLGPKDFREGLRFYLKKHQYANATTEDLWDAFEYISKKPIKKMMRNWTFKAGYPVVTVLKADKSLTLHQSRFFSSEATKLETKDNTLWSIPINLKRQSSKSLEKYLLDEKTLKIPLGPKDQEQWIKLNWSESSFIRVDYSENQLNLFKKAIIDKNIHPLDRLGIIRDAFDLSESGLLPTHFALELSQDYQGEDDFTVWSEIATHLIQVSNLLSDEKFHPKYKNFAQTIFSKITKKIGWESNKDESHTQVLLRSLALYSFGSFGDSQTIEEAKNKFFNYIKKGKTIEADLRGVVYNLVAENGGLEEYKLLQDLYKKEQLQQEKDRLGRALTLFKDPKLLQKTLDFSLSQAVRAQDAVFIIRGIWMNPKGRDLAWEFVKNNWSNIRENYGGGHFLLSTLLQGAEEFVDLSAAKDIEKFFRKNPTPEAARTIAQALEQIYSNVAWLKRDKQGIEKFLV
ncbi:M1 family metallopeptidase [Candidatus Daviesbacteria bacterium]|nr:M1 family metallopeptidase [Candidatus Daviesbacteria bacterium]